MVDVGHELELARLHRERQHDERERETTRREEETTNGNDELSALYGLLGMTYCLILKIGAAQSCA